MRVTPATALLTAFAWAMVPIQAAVGSDGGMAGKSRGRVATEKSNAQRSDMRIRLTVNGQVITGTLADNATSRDFFSMLPMALELDDYAATEKISSLPRRLSTAGAPPGIDPSVGDLAYYAPWGNIAIFIKDFEYSKGLVSLGRIDSDIAVLSRPGPVQVTVEPVKE